MEAMMLDFTDDPRIRVRARFTDKAKADFLSILAIKGHPATAAIQVGVSVSSAYRCRKEDDVFAEAYDEALGIYQASLVAEAYRRGVEGVEEPLSYKGLKTGDTVRKYSDAILSKLLESQVPGFGKKLQVDTKVSGGVLVVHANAASPEDWKKKFVEGGQEPKQIAQLEGELEIVAEQGDEDEIVDPGTESETS